MRILRAAALSRLLRVRAQDQRTLERKPVGHWVRAVLKHNDLFDQVKEIFDRTEGKGTSPILSGPSHLGSIPFSARGSQPRFPP